MLWLIDILLTHKTCICHLVALLCVTFYCNSSDETIAGRSEDKGDNEEKGAALARSSVLKFSKDANTLSLTSCNCASALVISNFRILIMLCFDELSFRDVHLMPSFSLFHHTSIPSFSILFPFLLFHSLPSLHSRKQNGWNLNSTSPTDYGA